VTNPPINDRPWVRWTTQSFYLYLSKLRSQGRPFATGDLRAGSLPALPGSAFWLASMLAAVVPVEIFLFRLADKGGNTASPRKYPCRRHRKRTAGAGIHRYQCQATDIKETTGTSKPPIILDHTTKKRQISGDFSTYLPEPCHGQGGGL